MKKSTLTSLVIIISAILAPSSVGATDLSTAINYFLKIDPNFLTNLASSTISKTFPELNSEASKVVETTGSIFNDNKNLSPESNLEATTAMIKGQSATGEAFKVIIAQNTHLSSQLQVNNELTVKAKDSEISREQESDRLKAQAIDLKFSNSNPAFTPK